MNLHRVLCLCLLCLILAGCGEQSPLGLPTSYWKPSEPATGYQWYIDGKRRSAGSAKCALGFLRADTCGCRYTSLGATQYL